MRPPCGSRYVPTASESLGELSAGVDRPALRPHTGARSTVHTAPIVATHLSYALSPQLHARGAALGSAGFL
jgi:hypothetical protein